MVYEQKLVHKLLFIFKLLLLFSQETPSVSCCSIRKIKSWFWTFKAFQYMFHYLWIFSPVFVAAFRLSGTKRKVLPKTSAHNIFTRYFSSKLHFNMNGTIFDEYSNGGGKIQNGIQADDGYHRHIS